MESVMSNENVSKLLQIAHELADNFGTYTDEEVGKVCECCNHILHGDDLSSHGDDCPVVRYYKFLEDLKTGKIV